MEKNIPWEEARELLIARCGRAASEEVELSAACWRVLAGEVRAAMDLPPFARSPYDGYAFRAADSLGASKDNPVTLRVVETVPAGRMPLQAVGPGQASRIMTGAPIPQGADTVVMSETTEFTGEAVTIFSAAVPGLDVVPAGEDMAAGSLIAGPGDLVDPALAGSLAAQGLTRVRVYRRPRVGVISTGDELVEADQPVTGAAVRNSNRYALEAACVRAGAEPVYLGRARDETGEIAALMTRGLTDCEMIFTSGGVSVGDYDFTPAALDRIGAETLVRGVRMKPGGACAHGVRDGRLIFGLSGNPAAAMINFYALAWPCLRKLCGLNEFRPRLIKVTLADGFFKKSPNTRIISGRLDLSDGTAQLRATAVRGHAVLRTLIGCDVLAVIPAGSPPLPAGTVLDGYLID